MQLQDKQAQDFLGVNVYENLTHSSQKQIYYIGTHTHYHVVMVALIITERMAGFSSTFAAHKTKHNQENIGK